MTRRSMIALSAQAVAGVALAAGTDDTYGPPGPLPPDPHEAVRLSNDVLGVRVWGPPTRPTLSIGKADIWDRRWFEDRQPLVTADRIRELAFADRISEIAPSPNQTVYDLYGRYDFPCPKPGVQVAFLTPFAEKATLQHGRDGDLRLTAMGGAQRLTVTLAVALTSSLLFAEIEAEGLNDGDLQIRVFRHRDTIVGGQPVDPTLGGAVSPMDFDQLPMPQSWVSGDLWGVFQDFGPDSTFPGGFRFIGAATLIGHRPTIEVRDGETGLGTPLWAEQEGRLGHGVVKRYAPINEAPGAAATAWVVSPPESLGLLVTLMTTQDDDDVTAAMKQQLSRAARIGIDRLKRQREQDQRDSARPTPARATRDGAVVLAAPTTVPPSLRKPGGYYGDIALCSVDSTRFCFQDAALWHADFHLNEVRAEGMLTLGQFEEVRPFCDMIHTMLPQAQENARAVYGLPGAMYPLVGFPLKTRGVAHTNLTWEQDMGLNGLISKPLWLWYRYTGDTEFLRDTAYPVLRECARFMAAYVTEEEDGRLHIVPTVSPEHWGLTPRFERNRDCTSALTLTRYLLRAAATAADTLGVDPEEAARWVDAAGRLAPFPTYDTPDGPVWVDVAGAPPIEYNIPVPLSPVFWGDEVGLDSPQSTQEVARRTLAQIQVWEPHRGYLNATVRPRLGIWTDDMTLGAENLLQSYQSLRLFPAVPPQGEIMMENMAAEGGLRVSAVRTGDGAIADVRVHSTLGGRCRMANPWPGSEVVVRAPGHAAARVRSSARHVALSTQPGQTLTVEPTRD